MDNQTVCIEIVCDEALPLCAYYIQLGTEEEGVPSRVDLSSVNNILEEAKSAADRSRLLVGVAASMNEMVIHHQRLPKENPILKYTQNEQNARLVGKNAARLVKGLPFDLGKEV